MTSIKAFTTRPPRPMLELEGKEHSHWLEPNMIVPDLSEFILLARLLKQNYACT